MFTFKIALRYLFSKKSTNAINIISLITAFAIGVGTVALIVILSVFNGLEGLIKSLYTVFYPEIAITSNVGKTFEITDSFIETLQAEKSIHLFAYSLEENVLVEYGEQQHICTLKAVDNTYFKIVNNFKKYMLDGTNNLFADSIPLAIVGAGVALNLNLQSDQAYQPLKIYTSKNNSSMGANIENAFDKSFINTTGTFSVSDEFDGKFIIVPLSFLQNITQKYNTISQVDLKLKSNIDIEKTIQKLKQKLGKNYTIKSRYQQNVILYKILKTEKWAVFAILSFILLVASFNIIGSLSMLVLEKKKDIALLTALGITQKQLLHIFLLEGILMSMLGGIIGIFIAFIICILQQKIGIIPMPGSTFLVDYYPVEMQLLDFILVFLLIVMISFFAAYLPAKKATLVVEKDYLGFLS